MVRPPVAERRGVSSIRLTESERHAMEEAASKLGLKSVSDYLRHLHRQHAESKPTDGRSRTGDGGANLSEFLLTNHGTIFEGNSLSWLHDHAKPNSVDLIMTSPPFGLVRKKTYGNEDADLYCNWFRPFAEGFKRVLKDTGSLVIDIGGAWKPGLPTRSLYNFELLIMLCREYGFHLCQEHYWWNPAKLPTPAEWVNVRRVRVKDAVNTIWWLSPSPFPKANNRRVLAPYSGAMKDLLKNGYTAKMRPSGHDISTKFQKDNGGAVPPNLLAIANTESNGVYQDFCRANNREIHPARFPALLPEYFIRMLTDQGDLVVDPFGGSCVTGMVAESLKRKWVCVEMNREYLHGAKARFSGTARGKATQSKNRQISYEIPAPCGVPVDESLTPFFADGGAARSGNASAVLDDDRKIESVTMQIRRPRVVKAA